MSRRSAIASRCVLVQVITLGWDKSARGGQGARDRNGVPRALAVPADRLDGAGGMVLVEESSWDGRDGFRAPHRLSNRREPIEAGHRFGCVTMVVRPAGLRVGFRWDDCGPGLPRRSGRHELELQPGQWARYGYHRRLVDFDTGHWSYEQTTINVALFDGLPTGDVFLASAPDHEVRLLARLR